MKEKTIIAVSTPLGKGAIGIVRLSGEAVLEIIKNFLCLKNQKKVELQNMESHKLYLAEILDDGVLVDEVMVVLMKAPKSYTGENTVEISCHNNFYVLNKILELAKKFGAELAKAGEFTERAFLNGKLDLSQAEAVLDVIHAESSYAEKIAQKQLKGGLTKEAWFFRNKLLDILKDLEIVLDHDGIMNLDKQKLLQDLEGVRGELCQKVKIGERTNKFYNGLKIAIIGRPNVGKSSILNSIIDKEKAIVSDVPGTTRDPIEVRIEHREIKIELVDTAGLKHMEELNSDFENKHGIHSELEKKGIIKTKEYLEQADVVFFIVDLSQKVGKYDELLLTELEQYFRGKKIFLVGNKADLCVVEYNFLDSRLRDCVITSKLLLRGAQRRGNLYEGLDCRVLVPRPRNDKAMLRHRHLRGNDAVEGENKIKILKQACPRLRSGIQDDKLVKYIWTIMGKFEIKEFIKISAKTGKNIDKLLDLCVDDFLKTEEIGIGEQNFMVNARHKIVFDEVIKSLELAIDLVKIDEPLEMIAVDIRRAIDLLGEVLGLGIDEEILDRIFSNFCVGK